MSDQFTMSDLAHRTGTVADAADHAPVRITRHGRPRYVLVRAEEFDRLTRQARDPRRVLRTSETPQDIADIFAQDIAAALDAES